MLEIRHEIILSVFCYLLVEQLLKNIRERREQFIEKHINIRTAAIITVSSILKPDGNQSVYVVEVAKLG